jgi:hypothetical protein
MIYHVAAAPVKISVVRALLTLSTSWGAVGVKIALGRTEARVSEESLHEVLGRWTGAMVNARTYAEIVDRHVEPYSRLSWWGSVLDEHEPLEEHLSRPMPNRVTKVDGPEPDDRHRRDHLTSRLSAGRSALVHLTVLRAGAEPECV